MAKEKAAAVVANTKRSVGKNMGDVAEQYLGQKVALLCARFQYRGILVAVNDNSVTLANPVSVEESGAAMSDKATREDPIGCSLTISLDAVEILYQPAFAMAPLPGEPGWTAQAQQR